MKIRELNELKETSFEKVEQLRGCSSFREYESKYDEYIFYADGAASSCMEALKDEAHVLPVECYLFDGWYVVER